MPIEAFKKDSAKAAIRLGFQELLRITGKSRVSAEQKEAELYFLPVVRSNVFFARIMK